MVRFWTRCHALGVAPDQVTDLVFSITILASWTALIGMVSGRRLGG